MPSHALLPPDTHPHASALPPRCPTPFRAMPSCPGITLHGNAPLSLPGRRAHAEARTGTQTGAQAGAGPALRQYAAEQKIPPRILAGKRRPAPPPDSSPPNSPQRIPVGKQPPPLSSPDTHPHTQPPRNTHPSRDAHPTQDTHPPPPPRRSAATPLRRHAAPPPHAVARHLTVPLRQTHARTKKRSTLADASPLFGNVEFVTRPERNACRQLR